MRTLATIATFSLLFQQAVYAQTVSYNVDNKTNKLAPVKVGLAISFASGNQIMAGGMVQGCLANKLFYNAEYRVGLVRGFSNAGIAGEEELQTTQSETKGSYMEAGAEWTIRDKMSKSKMRISTGSTGNIERFFYAECDMRKLITVGGGVFSISHAYYLGDDSAHYFTSGSNKLQPATDKIFHSNISTMGAFGGVSLRKIRKGVVTSGGYRYRTVKITSWSFQALIGGSKMQDLVIGGNTYPINNAKSAPIGYRIIWRAERGRTSTTAELGMMPHVTFDNNNNPDMSMFGPEGISSPINYFKLGFNFILYGNERSYGLKQKKS